MKTKISMLSLSVIMALGLVGCGGGGGGGGGAATGGGNTSGTVSASSTSVSGTTGSGSSSSGSSKLNGLFSTSKTAITQTFDTTATLVVDKDGDGKLDTKSDFVYSTPVMSNGSFNFKKVTVADSGETKALLKVEKQGYAPVVQTLKLKKDAPISIYAKVGKKPVLTQVSKLPTSAAERANSFLKLGITKTSSGVKAYSKLMTLSELKAEGVGFGEGTLSTTVIPVSAFSKDVSSVTAKMQAFDSTKKEDIAYFPGSFSGHGKASVSAKGTLSSDATEHPLESAAFDMIQLTDQNGKDITLQPVAASKLPSLGASDASSCSGMYWTRYVNSEQMAIIKAWGDDDNTTAGFQVPIWSNDNESGSWAYVGEGLFDETSKSFSACVDTKWEGYLNCDSEISIGTKPKEMCVSVVDQNNNPMNGLSFTAKKGNTYHYGYLDQAGKTTLDVDDNVTSWGLTYKGAITSWYDMDVNVTPILSTTVGCDYDLNITVESPYSASVYVYADDNNGKPVNNADVSLYSSDYQDYYYKDAYTNSKGYAVFKVKPNQKYTALYKAGSADVNVNNTIDNNETADGGKYATVYVADTEVKPTAYVDTYSYGINDTTESLQVYISGYDGNGDALTLKKFTLNGTKLSKGSDYTVDYESKYAGSYYATVTLDLNSSTLKAIEPSSLAQGNYTLSAEISDGKLSATSSATFKVNANRAPTIQAIYLYDDYYNYYYSGDTLKKNVAYNLNAYVYDSDASDTVEGNITVDGGTPYNSLSGDRVTFASSGNHTIKVSATDGNLTVTKSIKVHAGDNAPVIASVAASTYMVDINDPTNNSIKLYANVVDADGDTVTVTATDDANNTYTLNHLYGNKYVSDAIVISQAKLDNQFIIVANDGELNSTAATVHIESIANNQAPIFTKSIKDSVVNVGTSNTFECVASDPEGTFVSYSWMLDEQALSDTTSAITETFNKSGSHRVSCTATDEDGKSSTATAAITVIDPSVSNTLTLHTGMQGLVVAVHSLSDKKVVQQKFTDANGDVSFSVNGDRTTFSVTAYPDMEIYQDTVMKLTKGGVVNAAKNACDYNSSVASQCPTADWCAMSQADTIEDWAWDLSANNDSTKPAATDIDSDADGKITEAELYTAAKSVLDVNKDGKLSFAEMQSVNEYNEGSRISMEMSVNEYNEGSRISMEMSVNIPVGEYTYHFDYTNGNKYDYSNYNICNAATNNKGVISIAMNDSNDSKDISAGFTSVNIGDYFSNDPIVAGDYNITLNPLVADKDGNYDYLVGIHNRTNNSAKYVFLKDQTLAAMQNGVHLNENNFKPADKNVTLIDDRNASGLNGYLQLNIQPTYKGTPVGYSTELGSNNGNSVMMYDNADINYTLNIYANNKNAYNYYGGVLKDTYTISDYPMLDADVIWNKDGSLTFTGSELSKVNSVDYYYSKSFYDENSSTSKSINIDIMWTVAPTQVPTLDLTQIVPDVIKDDVTAIVSADANQSNSRSSISMEEYKGMSEDDFINFMQSTEDSQYFYGEYGMSSSVGIRTVWSHPNGEEGYSTLNADKKVKQRAIRPMFTLPYHAPRFK